MQSSNFYRPRISNQPIFTGKCVRSMEKKRWLTEWFDDGVGNLKVVEITCTTTNAAVAQRRDSWSCAADWGENPQKQTLHHHGSGRIFPECVMENRAPDHDWNSVPDGFQKILPHNTKWNVWDLHFPFWSATRTVMSFSHTSLPVMKHGYPMSPQKVSNSPCSGVTHHPLQKKIQADSPRSQNHVHGILGPLRRFAPWLPSKWTINQCPGVLRHPTTLTRGYLKQTPGTTQL